MGRRTAHSALEPEMPPPCQLFFSVGRWPRDGYHSRATNDGFGSWLCAECEELNVSRSGSLRPTERASTRRAATSLMGHFRTHASQQIAACSISSSGTSRVELIRAVPLSEGPQLAASSVIARRER